MSIKKAACCILGCCILLTQAAGVADTIHFREGGGTGYTDVLFDDTIVKYDPSDDTLRGTRTYNGIYYASGYATLIAVKDLFTELPATSGGCDIEITSATLHIWRYNGGSSSTVVSFYPISTNWLPDDAGSNENDVTGQYSEHSSETDWYSGDFSSSDYDSAVCDTSYWVDNYNEEAELDCTNVITEIYADQVNYGIALFASANLVGRASEYGTLANRPSLEITYDYPQTSFTLTVNSGSGSGTYVETDVANISADAAPSGQEFDEWIGDTSGIASVTSSATTLTMPAASQEVTATYTDKTWTLTVNSGTGDGDYVVGTEVGITADAAPSGYEFDEWAGDTEGIASLTSASTTLTMPYADAEVTASYAALYTLTVNSGTGDGSYGEGTAADIDADSAPSGMLFDYWSGDTSGIADVNDASTTLTMPASDAEITANYTWVASGLVARFTFDTDARDTYGTNDGTLTNGASIATNGTRGKVLSLDGENDYVSLPSSAMAAGRSEVTLSIWIKPDTWASGDTIYDEYASTNYWQFTLTNSGGSFYTRDSSTGTTGSRDNDVSMPTIATSSWQHLAAVYSVSGGTKELWHNGVLYDSSTTSIDTLTSTRDGVGIGYACDGNNFDGMIDDVRLYSRALNSTEIALLAEKPFYTLTVNNGTGDGDYIEDTVVDVDADTAPSGQDFVEWTGDTAGLASVSSSSTTITMPASNAEITATYTDKTWTLTVNSGTGDGSYVVSTVVDIDAEAAPSGQDFDEWVGDTTGIASVSTAATTLTMPYANAEITATYTDKTWTLTVNSGTGDGSYVVGAIADIDADTAPSGQDFEKWIGDTSGIASTTTADTTLTMPYSNAEITATYTDKVWTLTVNSGAGDGSYAASTIVDINADTPSSGNEFDEWTGDTAGIANVSSASTTLTMPYANVEVTATYTNASPLVYKIDFSDADTSPSPGSSWYTKDDAGTTTVTLTDSNGSTNGGTGGNGVTMTLGSYWNDATNTDQNGAFDGGDFAAAAEDYLYVQNTTATVTFKFYGTSAESDWDVEVISSRGSSGAYRVGDYKVENSFSDDSNSDDFNAYDDGYVAGDVMTWSDVTPDGSDEITVSVITTSPSYGYLNAIRLTGGSAGTPTYTLTVNSGSGDGSYAESAVADITADTAPSGQEFDEWVGDTSGIASVTSASTTLTMPASDQDVTATYTDIAPFIYNIDFSDADSSPAPGSSWYTKNDAGTTTVTLTDSTGSTNGGTGGNGVTMTLGSNWNKSTYTDQNGAFDGGDFAAAAEDYLYVSNTTATITFTFYGSSAAEDWKVEIVSSRGSSGSNRVSDYTVESSYSSDNNSDDFNAYDDGYVAGDVMEWSAVTPDGSDQITVSVTTSSSGYGYISAIRLTGGASAGTTYTLTVNSGSGDGSYAESTIVDITADSAASGQEFDDWTGDTSGIADVNDPTTTITMPAANTEVTATYQAATLYTLTVNSGTGDGSYQEDWVVDIDADSPASGKQFDEWVGDTSGIASVTNSSTTLTMPGSNAEITATYEDIPAGTGPSISSVSDSTPTHGQSITISGSSFGTKSYGAAPQKYEDFEDGTDGELLTTTGYWNMSSNNPTEDKPQFSDEQTRHADSGLSGKFIEYGLQDMTYTPDLNFSGRKIYIDLWMRFQWASLTAQHQNKLFKIQSKVNSNGGSDPDAYPIMNFYAWRHDGGGSWCYIPLSNTSGSVCQENMACPGNTPAWYHWQIELLNNDIGSANGEYRVWRNGTLLAEAYDLEIRLTGDNNFNCLWLGRYLGNYEGDLSNTLYYDEVYLDDSWARVEIGNASTWSACSHRETQIPSAWSSSSITVTVNQGTFADSSGAYLYVTDDDGNVNSSGYSITFAN